MKKLTLAIAIIFLSGCASTRSLRLQAKDDLVNQDFDTAETKLISQEIVGESKNQLLTLIELGTVAHYQGNFEKSNTFFFKAKKMSERLFTTSISDSALTLVFNDNSEKYEGMEYELSMLHYYTTMNFVMLSQASNIPEWNLPEIKDGENVVFAAETHETRELGQNDRNSFRRKARSEILVWDSYLQVVRQRNRGKPYYKDDLLNKMLAAFVHRVTNSSEDRQIASVLYQDAEKLLVRSSSSYSTFNQQHEEFIDNYSKFSKLGETAVKAKFINATPHYSHTEKQISDSQKNLEQGKGNVLVLLEVGTVAEKREKRFTIGLSTIFKAIKDPELRAAVEQIGLRIILQVVPEIGIPMVAATIGGAAASNETNRPKSMTEAMDRVIGFDFKLPYIPAEETNLSYTVKFVNQETSETITSQIAVTNPISDIAHLNVDRRAASVATKTGIRAGLKYLAALVPAVIAYQQTPGPKFVKSSAAAAVWMGGKALVDATESADIRAWNMLPKWVGMAETDLPNGKYDVVAVSNADEESSLGELVVNGEKTILKKRLFDPKAPASAKTQEVAKLN